MTKIVDLSYKMLFQEWDDLDAKFFALARKNIPEALQFRATRAPLLLAYTRDVLAAVNGVAPNDAAKVARMMSSIKNFIFVEDLVSAIIAQPSAAEYLKTAYEHQKSLNLNYFYNIADRLAKYIVWSTKSICPPSSTNGQTISAIMRVKNEIRHIRTVLDAVLFYFDEIVLIDNGSTDGTYEYLLSITSNKVKLFNNKEVYARASEFYANELELGKPKLSSFYADSFALGKGSHLCKWDADMYPLPLLGAVLDQIRNGDFDIAYINGIDCYGLTSCNSEPRIFRRDCGYKFLDAPYYETLTFEGERGLKAAKVGDPVYMHMKYL